ncbi:MAG: TetR/AcrR family transcriptional regulator, partial [Pseudomonadota bacterium]
SSKYAKKKLRAIESAAAVFAEKGFHGATTEDIASELGVKQGSLYYYFDSKEAALQQVCEYGFENYVLQMRKIVAREQAFSAKMYAIVTSHLSRYRQKSNALKVHNDQRLYLPKERREKLKELGTSYREMLEQTLQEGIEQAELDGSIDVHFHAYSIIGLCNFWGANLIRDEALDLVETIDQCAEFIFNGLLSNN